MVRLAEETTQSVVLVCVCENGVGSRGNGYVSKASTKDCGKTGGDRDTKEGQEEDLVGFGIGGVVAVVVCCDGAPP